MESTVLEYSVFLFQPFRAQTEHTRCVLYSVVLPLPVSTAVSSSKCDLFDPPSRAGTFEGEARRPISRGSATPWDRLLRRPSLCFLIPELHICHHLTHLLPLGWCSTVVVKCSIQTDVLSELMGGAVTKKKSVCQRRSLLVELSFLHAPVSISRAMKIPVASAAAGKE